MMMSVHVQPEKKNNVKEDIYFESLHVKNVIHIRENIQGTVNINGITIRKNKFNKLCL